MRAAAQNCGTWKRIISIFVNGNVFCHFLNTSGVDIFRSEKCIMIQLELLISAKNGSAVRRTVKNPQRRPVNHNWNVPKRVDKLTILLQFCIFRCVENHLAIFVVCECQLSSMRVWCPSRRHLATKHFAAEPGDSIAMACSKRCDLGGWEVYVSRYLHGDHWRRAPWYGWFLYSCEWW